MYLRIQEEAYQEQEEDPMAAGHKRIGTDFKFSINLLNFRNYFIVFSEKRRTKRENHVVCQDIVVISRF